MKTISLQNAKKLHEVAVKYGVELPESEYWYTKYNHDKFALMTLTEADERFKEDHTVDTLFSILATTDELLEWLPDGIDGKDFCLIKHENGYSVYYYFVNGDMVFTDFLSVASTPADALCLLAIKMIEKGIIN